MPSHQATQPSQQPPKQHCETIAAKPSRHYQEIWTIENLSSATKPRSGVETTAPSDTGCERGISNNFSTTVNATGQPRPRNQPSAGCSHSLLMKSRDGQ